jgi:hypothetical protein
MLRALRRPNPSLVLAMVALFVALSGTAVAAGIVPHARLADHAKVASNALLLQGKSATQVAALAAAPASLAGYITVKSTGWSLNASQANDFSVACDSGQKAIAGGYDNANTSGGVAIAGDTRPSSDGGSWGVLLVNLSDSATAAGNVYAVCLR